MPSAKAAAWFAGGVILVLVGLALVRRFTSWDIDRVVGRSMPAAVPATADGSAA